MRLINLVFEGTSHGDGYCGQLQGIPSGYVIDIDSINNELALRKGGIGRSSRQTNEQDQVRLVGLNSNAMTTGQAICFSIANNTCNILQRPNITALRSGHIDVVVANKYGADSVRAHNEIASSRNSVCYVIAGCIAQQVLKQQFDIDIMCHTRVIAGIEGTIAYPTVSSDRYPLLCSDTVASQLMSEAIELAKDNGDSLGGMIEIVVCGVGCGLGNYIPYSSRIDGILGGAMMSIPSVKAVEFGIGRRYAVSCGREVADQIAYQDGKYEYTTNNCGGIVGGMTTGQPIRITLTVKPVPTVQGIETIDSMTHQVTTSHTERADTCIVPAVGIIARNIIALELLDIILQQ